MEKFSLVKHNLASFEEKTQLESLRAPVSPFPENERSDKAVIKRLVNSVKDFWKFDRYYFTEEMYGESYAAPNEMLLSIIDSLRFTDTSSHAEIYFGPRKHGKTVTGKKALAWLLLTGRVNIAATYAETLPKSSNIMKDVCDIVRTNERIVHDFRPEFMEDNADQFQFRCAPPALKSSKLSLEALFGNRYCMCFSEGRSLRGYTRMFDRPKFILGDDVETLESSFGHDAVRLRVEKLSESFHSMDDGGIFLILGNDFNTAGALHRLRIEQEAGILNKQWRLRIFKAWQDGRPLWSERYKASSEGELRRMLAPTDEADYQANYQQNPIPPDGDFFKRDLYHEWTVFNADARGVVYVDPNLSKKGKGDTTAIAAIFYDHENDAYMIYDPVCKSFSDSNHLLDATFRLKDSSGASAIGFDGHVNQESTWTNNVRNFCRIKKQPFPRIEYKRYKVNDIAKNFQLAYAEGRVYFPPGFAKTPDGERFLSQFFAFTGTKKNDADDAPDALICAFEFLHERGGRKRFNAPTKSFTDYYML